MTDFPSIAGVRATDRADGGLALTFDDVSEATCRRVVAALPEDRQLTFHDPYFPQLSEPGAYV